MSIDYLFLGLAIFLLWFPRQWMRWGSLTKRKRRVRMRAGEGGVQADAAESTRLRLFDEFKDRRNVIDFLRALTGGWALVGGWALKVPEGLGDEETLAVRYWIIAVQTAVLITAVLIQTVRYRRRVVLFAPVTYVVGLTFGVLGLEAAGFGLVLIVALNLVAPGALVFFSAYAIILLLFGGFFLRFSGMVFAMCVIVVLPALLGMLAKRELQPTAVPRARPSTL